MMRWHMLAEWIGFQLVWLACAFSAANCMNAPGVAVALVYVCAVLASKGWPRADVLAVLLCGVAGFMIESALALSGLVRFAAKWPSTSLAPAWLVALWLAFGVTLGALQALFAARSVAVTAALGAIAGPLAYWAGERLGALDVAAPRAAVNLTVAAIWAVALPLLLAMRRR